MVKQQCADNNKIPHCVCCVKNKNSPQEMISTNCSNIFMSAKLAFIVTTKQLLSQFMLPLCITCVRKKLFYDENACFTFTISHLSSINK